MSTVSVKLRNVDQYVLLDEAVHSWLATDPLMKHLQVLDYLYQKDFPRIVFLRTIRVSKDLYEKHSFYLHTLIAETFLTKPADSKGMTVCTVNGNHLDCRLENLEYRKRGTTKRMHPTTCQTGYRGVHPAGKYYKAVIFVKGKYQHLGYFATARQAAICYNTHATEIFGDHCWHNTIPEIDPEAGKVHIGREYKRRTNHRPA